MKHSRQAGFTLIEMTIVAAALVPILMAILGTTQNVQNTVSTLTKVSQLTEQVDRHQDANTPTSFLVDQSVILKVTFGRKELTYSNGIKIIGIRVNVAEHGASTEARDYSACREETEWRSDNLVTGTDIESHQRYQQCICSRRNAYAIF